MGKKLKQQTIEALFMVIDEFEEKPIPDARRNDVLIEILSERVETISTSLEG